MYQIEKKMKCFYNSNLVLYFNVISPEMNCLSEFQLAAGKEVLLAFEKDTNPWHLLFAQPQSGKTDTFYFIAAEMLRLNKVDNIVILSGAVDTQLKNQCKQSFCSTNGSMDFCEKYDRYLETDLNLNRDKRFQVRSHLKSNLHIIWGNDLCKSHSFTSNTLFVWDESHYAQNIGMRPFQFFKDIGISCDGKNVPNNNYILSVSATPFSELSHILKSIDEPFKGKTFLRTNENYHSVDRVVRKNLLIPFDSDSLSNTFEDILKSYSEPTFGIVRSTNSSNTKLISSIAKQNNWVVLNCNSDPKTRDISNLCVLEKKPLYKTIIIIKGMCRMGQVIHKEHLSFVMETSFDSNAETVIQGLLGRTLGWHNHLIKVYINHIIVNRDDIGKYIDFILGENVLPKKFRNIKKNGTNSCDSFCGNLKLPVKRIHNKKSIELHNWLLERVDM